MMKKTGILLLMIMIMFSAFTMITYAAVDTHFMKTIASANGRVYVIKNDGSLWYSGSGTFNDSAGDQSSLRADYTKILDHAMGVYGDWWSGFTITADSSLWAIGDCADGNGGTHEDTEPPIKMMDGVKDVACSYSHWTVLKTDGTVWQWSYENDAFSSHKIKQIMSGVKQISANIHSYYAIKEDNTLWGWGENYSGELGVKTGKVLIYTPIKIMNDVERVYASGISAYVIKKDHTLWGWGENDDGIIFTGKAEKWAFDPYPDGSQSVVTSVFTPAKLMNDVKSMDGRNHLAVIKNDNSLWVWGRNDSGELGDGTTERKDTPEKLADDVVDVTAKGDFTVYLKSDGTLWGCGTNGCGELGIGKFDDEPHTTPIKIMDQVAIPNTAVSYPSSWAEEDVVRADKLGLIPGELNESFGVQITRTEFCALAVKLYETVKGSEIKDQVTFADDNGDINVRKAGALFIASGTGDNMFMPEGLLTREQAAVMISNLAEAIGKPLPKAVMSFTDNAKVSAWAAAPVGQVQTAGIMGGVGGNTFSPRGNYTREQSIVTMLRFYDSLK